MSRKSLKSRKKLNKVISFMLTLVMVVTMLPLFSMPEVYVTSTPTVSINDYAKTGNSYKITDISINNFTYGISSITFSVTDKSDVINMTTTSDVNISNSNYSKGMFVN